MIPPPRALRLPGGEPVLAYGPARGPQLVLLQPLFEEMNRCRALVAGLCRRLAAAGVGCWLPDLPGTGEDARALAGIAWQDWRDTVAATLAHIERETGVRPATAAIRGGALLDGASERRWRLSPVAGASLLRDLERAGLTGEEMAGYAPSPDLREALRTATPDDDARTLRLTGDERGADLLIDGLALWRRSEPAFDEALATALADDILAFLSPPRTGETTAGIAADPSVRPGGGRTILSLPLADGWIAATLDGPAEATRGWVFVTGGTQTRVGPARLYERLASALAAAGDAVIRYDRRGVGDSPGNDHGYADQGAEIATALAALRAARPAVASVAGFGLCDGATALALHARDTGIDRLVLANPWVIEPAGEEPPAAAIRAHYRERLLDPAAWRRLIAGGVDLRKLVASLRGGTRRDDTALAAHVAAGIPAGSTIVLADGDGTARAFADAWRRIATPRVETVAIATRSHGFAGADAFAALAAAVTRRR